MESIGKSLFEQHDCSSVVCAPSCMCAEVLEGGDVGVKVSRLHFEIQQFLVSALYFGCVGEGQLEVSQEHIPECLMLWQHALGQGTVHFIQGIFYPVVHPLSTDI